MFRDDTRRKKNRRNNALYLLFGFTIFTFACYNEKNSGHADPVLYVSFVYGWKSEHKKVNGKETKQTYSHVVVISI